MCTYLFFHSFIHSHLYLRKLENICNSDYFHCHFFSADATAATGTWYAIGCLCLLTVGLAGTQAPGMSSGTSPADFTSLCCWAVCNIFCRNHFGSLREGAIAFHATFTAQSRTSLTHLTAIHLCCILLETKRKGQPSICRDRHSDRHLHTDFRLRVTSTASFVIRTFLPSAYVRRSYWPFHLRWPYDSFIT